MKRIFGKSVYFVLLSFAIVIVLAFWVTAFAFEQQDPDDVSSYRMAKFKGMLDQEGQDAIGKLTDDWIPYAAPAEFTTDASLLDAQEVVGIYFDDAGFQRPHQPGMDIERIRGPAITVTGTSLFQGLMLAADNFPNPFTIEKTVEDITMIMI